VKDPQRAKRLIGETAQLEFKLMDEDNPLIGQLPLNVSLNEEEKIVKEFQAKLRKRTKSCLREWSTKKRSGLKKALSGQETGGPDRRSLTDARVAIGQFNEPYVSITF